MNHSDPEQMTVPPDGRPESEQPAWRRDFPVDWPQDNYVARRDFAKFLGLTSLAFVVGQFWIGVQNWLRKQRGLPPRREIARVGELQPGQAKVFRYPAGQDVCLLLCRPDGSLLAYSQKCTHLSCAVVPEMDKHRLHCPCHHGYFDLATGRPTAGPARRPLPRIKLEIADGVIYATGVEEATT